jgi:predicted metal-dependent hydrolase
MRKAAALFNNGLFFECHEFLEAVWRSAPPADRDFYHGVILIAAACYHYEKGNAHGARVKLRQGIALLRPYLPGAHGVRLDAWLAALEPWRARVDAGQITGVLAPDEIPAMPLDRAQQRRR